MIEQGKQIASHVLEAARRRYRVRAGALRHCRHRPLDRHHGARREAALRDSTCRRACRSTLDVRHVSDGPAPPPFPTAAMSAEVEIDPDTGVIEVVKYSSVNDFGTVINPLIVEGQLHGGVDAGHRTGIDGDDGLRRRRPVPDRLVHGLCAAARAAIRRMSASINHPVPATTNGSASKAAAKPAAPARSPR